LSNAGRNSQKSNNTPSALNKLLDDWRRNWGHKHQRCLGTKDHFEHWVMRQPLINKFEKGGIERQGKCRGDQPTPQEGSGE